MDGAYAQNKFLHRKNAVLLFSGTYLEYIEVYLSSLLSWDFGSP